MDWRGSREAFILFCLLVDPDPATWRAWLGYKNSNSGNDFTPPRRNSGAYLNLLKSANDVIDENTIAALVDEPRNKSRGSGGTMLRDRAKLFIDLRSAFVWNGSDAAHFVDNIFDPARWITDEYDSNKAEGAVLDLQPAS